MLWGALASATMWTQSHTASLLMEPSGQGEGDGPKRDKPDCTVYPG